MLSIVLVEPEIPQNTGNISRTCAVTGCALHLVEPLGFSVDARQVKRAGLDYWDKLDITIHKDFGAVAALGRRLVLFSTHAVQKHTDFAFEPDDMLVFGKETAGLGAAFLQTYGRHAVRLPMREGLRSLNLSNAVAVAAYEALRQLGFPGMA